MWISYYTALPQVDLSLAAAAYYTAPLLITLLSARLAGDRVGWGVKFAVVLGFTGALVMLRPGSASLNVYLALPFIAALLYAFAMVVTRSRCAENDPVILALSLNALFVTVGVIATLASLVLEISPETVASNQFLWGSWTAVGIQEAVVMASLAVAMLIGSVGAAIAYQSGPPALIAIFDYMYLVFATLWGFFIFTEIPDLITIAGMSLITIGGFLAIHSQGHSKG